MKKILATVTVFIGVGLMGLTLSASADQQLMTADVEQSKPSCHLQEERASEWCQKVMFPPVPMR